MLSLFLTLYAREGAAGQAVVCPLLRGSSPTRGVAPKQHRGARLPLPSPIHAREGAAGQAVVCPLLRGSSPTRGVAPKQHNKAIVDQSPLLKLSLRRVRFQRTSTRQQLDCAKTLYL